MGLLLWVTYMSIEIQNFKGGPNGSKIYAYFDVFLPKIQLTLRNFRILKKKDGSGFITAPSFKKDFETGKDAWLPFFSFNQERQKQFMDELYELLKGEMEKMKQETQTL